MSLSNVLSQICSKRSLSYFQPILVAMFVTIVTVKVASIPDFLTLAIALINNKGKLVKSCVGGGKIAS